MRISDWSSDVCSSDLALPHHGCDHGHAQRQARLGRAGDRLRLAALFRFHAGKSAGGVDEGDHRQAELEIGRASCRERVCQYVKISVVAVSLKKKNATYTSHRQ